MTTAPSMLLHDPRLRFARDLIAHWTHIQRDALVPFEEDLDPRALMDCLRFVSIADVGRPNVVTFELVFPQVSRRYGRDIRKTDWFALMPPARRAAAIEAKRLFIAVPCGAYYRFAISVHGRRALEAESLSLPLRRHGAADPGMSITVTRDIAAADVPGAASAAPRQVEGTFGEFVDIGAGAPAFPSSAPATSAGMTRALRR